MVTVTAYPVVAASSSIISGRTVRTAAVRTVISIVSSAADSAATVTFAATLFFAIFAVM